MKNAADRAQPTEYERNVFARRSGVERALGSVITKDYTPWARLGIPIQNRAYSSIRERICSHALLFTTAPRRRRCAFSQSLILRWKIPPGLSYPQKPYPEESVHNGALILKTHCAITDEELNSGDHSRKTTFFANDPRPRRCADRAFGVGRQFL